MENKTDESIGFQSAVQANSRRDIDFSRIGPRQHDGRRTAHTMTGEANPQKFVGYAEMTEIEHDLNGLSHFRENMHYKAELSKVKDDASMEIMQLKSKITKLET